MDLSKGITLGASYFEWYVMDIKKACGRASTQSTDPIIRDIY